MGNVTDEVVLSSDEAMAREETLRLGWILKTSFEVSELTSRVMRASPEKCGVELCRSVLKTRS